MIDLCLVSLPNPALTNPTMYFGLGNLYLASVVKNLGFSVQIVDMRAGNKHLPDARFYGFSCTTPEITQAKKFARALRKQGKKTIVGGAHPTLMPEDCCLDFDYVVRGEGEQVIGEILNDKSDRVIVSSLRIEDLDEVPYPAWDMVENCFSKELFPGERYGRGEKAMTVITSRGCIYSCAFCANMIKGHITARSVNNVVGELEELKARDVNYVRFEDDNFTIRSDFDRLLVEIERLHIKWKCHTRSRVLKLSDAEMMKWAGCEEVGLGVESADDTVLLLNNKSEKVADHIQAVQILHKARLRAKTYFISGLPGETDKTLLNNKEFFRTVKPDKWTVATFTPYPGSAIYVNPKKFNIEIIEPDFSKWWNFVEDHFVHRLLYEPQEQTWARYREFYFWLMEGTWQK